MHISTAPRCCVHVRVFYPRPSFSLSLSLSNRFAFPFDSSSLAFRMYFYFPFFYCVERAQFSPPTGNSSKSWCVRSIQSFSHTGLTPGLTFISLPHLFLFSSSLHHLLFFIFLWYFLTFFSFSLSLAPSSYPSVRSINMPNRLCVYVCVYMLCHCILASSIHRDCTVPGRGHLSFSLLFSVHVPCLPPPTFFGGWEKRKNQLWRHWIIETKIKAISERSRIGLSSNNKQGMENLHFFCILFLILFMHLCFFVLQQDFYLFKEHTHTAP